MSAAADEQPWTGSCQRCGKASLSYTMSMFNLELICRECKRAERLRTDYAAAEVKDMREYADRVEALGNPSAARNLRGMADEMEQMD